jgi:hypothetical protein
MSEDPILVGQARSGGRSGKLDVEQMRLRGQLNTKFDTTLDNPIAVREDTDTTKDHVIYGPQEHLALSQRLSKLEDEMRRHKRTIDP